MADDSTETPFTPYNDRRHQMFPELTASEMERMQRFGKLLRFRRGDRLFAAGEPGPGMFVVLKGTVAVTQRDGAALLPLAARAQPVEQARILFSGGQTEFSRRTDRAD